MTGCVPAGLRDVPNNDIVRLGLPFCSEHPCVSGGAVVDATNTGLISDCEALLAARDTLAGTAALNWSADTPITEWNGVVLGGTHGHVTELDLVALGLNGRIPKELGSLANLRQLWLWGNQLTGEIPPELGGLSNLTGLWLWGNQLTGEIPPELGGLSNLTGLWLWGNQLTGEIPPELGSLSNLTELSLDGNQLTGEIPPELGSLANLTGLWLHGNQLTGEIPTELGNLSNLQRLSLWGNQLTGELPRSLTALTMLERFNFYNNPSLCAPIDQAFQAWLRGVASAIGSSCAPVDLSGDRAVLVELYDAMDGNNWTNNANWLSDEPMRTWHGVIIDANGGVNGLVLGRNQLTGEIPTELGSLSNLQRLYLKDNSGLSGPLPGSFTGLTSLTYLDLSGTGLCAPTDASFQAWLENIATRLGVGNCREQSTGDPLIDRYDANNNGTIEKNEVIAAINDYLFGVEDEAISKADVIRLITLYLFGPSKPHNPPTPANSPPTVAGKIPNQTLVVGDGALTIRVGVAFTDPDDDVLSYAAASTDENMARAGMSGAILSITPVA